MLKSFTIFILIYILHFIFFTSYADNGSTGCMGNESFEKYNFDGCSFENDYELYECRVKNICNQCINNGTKKLFQTSKYENADYYIEQSSLNLDKTFIPFEEVKKLYRSYQNSIYQCALIDSQERGLKTVKDKLLKIDKSGLLKTTIEGKIDEQKIKLEAKKNALKCQGKGKGLFQKKEVLDETTYELCKYSFYLDYLKDYYKKIENISGLTEESQKNMSVEVQKIAISQVGNTYGNITKQIDDEINHTYKIFPLAFEAYNEYENNFQIHFLLSIIKEDYIVVRDLLAKVLGPINQLVYKIKDAMSLN